MFWVMDKTQKIIHFELSTEIIKSNILGCGQKSENHINCRKNKMLTTIHYEKQDRQQHERFNTRWETT